MKVYPINNTNQTAFQGLWEKTRELSEGFKDDVVNKRRENYYHPFADEADSKIASSLDKKTYSVLIPMRDDAYMMRVVSVAKPMKKLSFTKAEFTEYKNFYKKVLPDNMKKIEQELLEKNLSQYINNKTCTAIKRFLHKIRII